MQSIPVLMYHHILPETGFLAASISQFEEQMRFLARNGFTSISLNQLYAYKTARVRLPPKSLVITFDDGWRDNAVYAYPILKKYGLIATIFIVTEWIEMASQKPAEFSPLDHNSAKQALGDSPGSVVLCWDHIEKVSDVFEFHSHTHTHRLEYFSQVGWPEDLSLSKEIIKARLGIDTTHLCWPHGKYDESLTRMAHDCGYRMLYTAKRGVNTPDGDCSHIKRLAVKKGARWLKKSLALFSNPVLGAIYARIKPE